MLKLTGKSGKSLVVEAIQKRYKDLMIYSYDDYNVMFMENYHVNRTECTVDEFCELVYKDIAEHEDDVLPVNIVIIYTNLEKISEIERLADRLEKECLVRMAIITGR